MMMGQSKCLTLVLQLSLPTANFLRAMPRARARACLNWDACVERWKRPSWTWCCMEPWGNVGFHLYKVFAEEIHSNYVGKTAIVWGATPNALQRYECLQIWESVSSTVCSCHGPTNCRMVERYRNSNMVERHWDCNMLECYWDYNIHEPWNCSVCWHLQQREQAGKLKWNFVLGRQPGRELGQTFQSCIVCHISCRTNVWPLKYWLQQHGKQWPYVTCRLHMVIIYLTRLPRTETQYFFYHMLWNDRIENMIREFWHGYGMMHSVLNWLDCPVFVQHISAIGSNNLPIMFAEHLAECRAHASKIPKFDRKTNRLNSNKLKSESKGLKKNKSRGVSWSGHLNQETGKQWPFSLGTYFQTQIENYGKLLQLSLVPGFGRSSLWRAAAFANGGWDAY